MAVSYNNLVASSQWVDIYATSPHSALAGQKVFIQNVAGNITVYFGGSSAPLGKNADDGIVLAPGIGFSGTTDHLWFKGDGRVSITQED